VNEDKKNIKTIFFHTLKSFGNIMPVLTGVVFLIGLADIIITEQTLQTFFRGGMLDLPAGVLLGTVMAGHALNSVIIGEQLFETGVGLMAVSAFMVSWVTIGVAYIAMEAAVLGKKFAFIKNILSILFAMIISFLTVVTLGVF
jgi:uncharacterized membrane protein YraQ (UPF0718 family)